MNIACVSRMKVQAITKSVCSEFSGQHVIYIGHYKERCRNTKVISKDDLSMDRRLKLTFLKQETIVIVTQDVTVNITLFNAHIARQVTRIIVNESSVLS